MREKKQKFRSIIGVIITITLFMLCGCNEAVNDKAVGKTTKVTIKKADGVSVYQLNADSKIQTVNTVNNRTGVNESRTYTYNNVNDLQQIKIDNSAYGISYMHYQTETQRSDGKILTKTKTVSKARGDNETYTLKYHYNDDGKLLGVEMRDDRGNIYTKGVDE